MPSIRYRDQAVFVLQPLRQLIEKEIRTVESLGYQFSHIVMVFDAAGRAFDTISVTNINLIEKRKSLSTSNN